MAAPPVVAISPTAGAVAPVNQAEGTGTVAPITCRAEVEPPAVTVKLPPAIPPAGSTRRYRST